MEECEVLCTRLAIMINGEFRCLGSPQHLKNKFGEGYSLKARVTGHNHEEVAENTERIVQFIQETFPNNELKDRHQGLVHFQIDRRDTTWSNAFGTLERTKHQYHITDYSISQTTLEQVFLSFAEMQTDPSFTDVNKVTKCKHCCLYLACCKCC